MRRFFRFFLCFTLFTLLIGCAAVPKTEVQAEPSEAEIAVRAQPEPQPEPEMEVIVEAEPEPEYALRLSEQIWFLGQLTDVYLAGETEWVSLSQTQQAAHALGLDVQPDTLASVTFQEQTYIQLDAAAELCGLEWGQSPDGLRYLAARKEPGEIPAGYTVPVFMYHAVSDDIWGYSELFVSPDSMEQQLQYLTENGYETIWFSDLAHIEDYEKPVILTFDDGYDDNYTELYPLLEKYQAKATIFVIGNAMGNPHKMTREQVYELACSGLVSIQSHSYTHGNMAAMDEQTLRWEMEQSNAAIAAVTGQVPYVLCFPEGRHSTLTVSVAKEYYSFSLLMNGSFYETGADPYQVQRLYVPRWLDLASFRWYLEAAGTNS